MPKISRFLKEEEDEIDFQQEEVVCEGFPLMEVLNITYLGLDEVEPEKQLGTIKLISGCGVQYLYNVEEVDFRKPSLKYGDAIVVTDTITFDGEHVYMVFDLFCGAYKGLLDFQWGTTVDEVYVTREIFDSKDHTGRILVSIGHIGSATIARLEVKLLDYSAATNVYGGVFASNSKLDLPDCANVLFLEKSDNRIKVGHDGVIPLSKSRVGVPLHSVLSVEISLNVDGNDHIAVVSFDAKEAGGDEKSTTTDKGARIQVNVTWGDVRDLTDRMSDQLSISQRLSVDKSGDEVEEVAALEFHLLKAQIKKNIAEKPTFGLSSITTNIICMFISYCENHDHLSTSKIQSDAIFVKELDPVNLFYLIQAAHHYTSKSLMNLTCRTLVNKVKMKTVEEIMKEFDIDEAYIHSAKRLKRGLYSIRESERTNVDSILRQRGKETFIKISHFVDEPIFPSFATERLRLVKKWNPIFDRCVGDFVELVDSQPRDLVKLLEAIKCLNNLINGDPGFADCLSSVAVRRLLQILDEIDYSKDRKDIDIEIQSLAVHILSRAISLARFHDYSRKAVPALVKLMSDPLTDFSVVVVIALTRLAYACIHCKLAILGCDALEKAQEMVYKSHHAFPLDVSELRHWIAKFLAVVCYKNLPRDKVKVALTILLDLFQKYPHTLQQMVSACYTPNLQELVPACYTLFYLTYKRRVAMEGDAWNKFIRRLIGFISIVDTPVASSADEVARCIAIARPAVGIVGNIARWGYDDQIQSLAKDPEFLRCLGKMLCSESKKFTKEACQIISNIAARIKMWRIQDMHEAKLIEPLCSLLEKDTCQSDVKMEAAWAIFNGIYGDKRIDMYPRIDPGDRMGLSPNHLSVQCKVQ